MAGGGEGNGREGVMVRERTRVGWIEETERKTKGCGLKEAVVRNHVASLPPSSSSLLCLFAASYLCLSDVYARTEACYVRQMMEMCGQGV